MFTLNNFITDIKEVPAEWIFENYLDLPEKLEGQRVRLNSIFNDADKDPSMFLYLDKETHVYKFKCFSTGKNGSAVNLLMYMWDYEYGDTARKILSDYNAFLNTGNTVERKSMNIIKWVVVSYEDRAWTQTDANFWLKSNISSAILFRYNVKALKSYQMCKYVNGNVVDSFVVSKPNVYGYFTKEGLLYKIYQPGNVKKFLKLEQHIQGIDQLEGKRFLVITSSLKDCMAIKSLHMLDIDVIAPDSENTNLPDKLVKKMISEYEAVVTYMDSDKAGINSMKYYLDKYNIPFCYIPQAKDFSDVIDLLGIKKAARIFIPILDKAVMKYKELNKIT